jgi:hypothetical protein
VNFRGDVENIFAHENQVVITKRIADTIFSARILLGDSCKFGTGFIIGAMLPDPPENSSLHFELVFSNINLPNAPHMRQSSATMAFLPFYKLKQRQE